jgi:hypothetical protein
LALKLLSAGMVLMSSGRQTPGSQPSTTVRHNRKLLCVVYGTFSSACALRQLR